MRILSTTLSFFFRLLQSVSCVFFYIADKLKIVYGQQLKGFDKFVHYYGLAVVETGANFSFKELKGKKSCHTGVGKTVGWKIPVGYLLYNKNMTFTKNQYKSAADFFGESCAPGRLNYIIVSRSKGPKTVLLKEFLGWGIKSEHFLKRRAKCGTLRFARRRGTQGREFFITLINFN